MRLCYSPRVVLPGMKKLFALYMVAGWASLLAGVACGETETASVECLKSATFLAPLDSPDHRKYAPDREIQGLHLALDVTPDFKQRTIRAKAVLRFKPIAKPVQEVKLDAVDLNILSLDASTKVQAWQATEDQVIVTFADPIPPDKVTTIELTYSAEPTQGLYFRTP